MNAIALHITDPTGSVNPKYLKKKDAILIEDATSIKGFTLHDRKQVRKVQYELMGKENIIITSVFRETGIPLLKTESETSRAALLTMCRRMALGDPLLDQYLVDIYTEAKELRYRALRLDAALKQQDPESIENDIVKAVSVNTW